MAEREGFEPSVVFSYARFPGVCLKPLSHLSAESALMCRAPAAGATSFCPRRSSSLNSTVREAHVGVAPSATGEAAASLFCAALYGGGPRPNPLQTQRQHRSEEDPSEPQ